uniref:Nuclear receptor domain-containing protein n=1 Tax=Rhabditophanes sp. KR3021 TaxID=114890 RepID=A0AC35UAD6_9BILA
MQINEIYYTEAIRNSKVNACRACSSFFKRTITLKLDYRCRRNDNGNCPINASIGGTKMCRYCRFQKCQSVGMTLKSTIGGNSKNDGETDFNSCSNCEDTKIMNPLHENIHHSVGVIQSSVSNGKPSIPIYLKTIEYDFNSIVTTVKQILNGPLISLNCSNGDFDLTLLQKTTLILRKNIAEMKLCPKEEICIKTFGADRDDCIFIVDKDLAFVINPESYETENLFSDISPEITNLMRPVYHFFTVNVYKVVRNLKLDLVEFSYILLQILWSSKKKSELSESTKFLAERMLKIASSELHNIYVMGQKENYAYHLVELTKVLASAHEAALMLQENALLAKIFNLATCPHEHDISPIV